MSEGSTLCEGLGPLVARIGSPPDTHCWDDDGAADCWSYSPKMVAELLEAAVAAERERCLRLLEHYALVRGTEYNDWAPVSEAIEKGLRA